MSDVYIYACDIVSPVYVSGLPFIPVIHVGFRFYSDQHRGCSLLNKFTVNVLLLSRTVSNFRGLSLPNKLNVELLIPMLSIAVPNTINTQIFTAEKRFLSNVSRLPLPCRPVHEDYLFPKKYAVKFTAVLNTRLDVYLGVSFPNLFVM